MKIILSSILDSEITYYFNGFKLDLYSDYELSIITTQISKLTEVMSMNRETSLALFMMDLVKQGKINWEGEPNCEFRKRRVKLSQAKRKIIDDYYLFKALNSFYSGLT